MTMGTRLTPVDPVIQLAKRSFLLPTGSLPLIESGSEGLPMTTFLGQAVDDEARRRSAIFGDSPPIWSMVISMGSDPVISTRIQGIDGIDLYWLHNWVVIRCITNRYQ